MNTNNDNKRRFAVKLLNKLKIHTPMSKGLKKKAMYATLKTMAVSGLTKTMPSWKK